jgi:hypothetical protein
MTQQRRLEESLHSVFQKLRDERKRLQAMSEISGVLASKPELRVAFPKISAICDEFCGRSMRLSHCTTKRVDNWFV